MKHYLICIAVLAAMFSAWHFDIYGLQVLMATFAWSTSILCVMASLWYSYLFSEYGEGKLNLEHWSRAIKEHSKPQPFKFAFNLVSSATNVTLLVLMGFGVTAAVYIISALIAIGVKRGCKKRTEPPK